MLIAFIVLVNLIMLVMCRHLICYAMSKASGWVTAIPLTYYRGGVMASAASLVGITNSLVVHLAKIS